MQLLTAHTTRKHTQCGFCESNCPSRDVTLTPRQRIATYKEIARLRGMPSKGPEEAAR